MDSPNVFYIDFMNKRGVEIDNEFLPFAYDCITSFKIDGDDRIIIKTTNHEVQVMKFSDK